MYLMPIKPPCEIIVQAIVPAIRSELVRQLFNVHGLKQTEIAEKLGITQPAVSQYISGSRGTYPGLFEDYPEIRRYVEEMAEDIASGKIDGNNISMCGPCQFLKKEQDVEGLPQYCNGAE